MCFGREKKSSARLRWARSANCTAVQLLIDTYELQRHWSSWCTKPQLHQVLWQQHLWALVRHTGGKYPDQCTRARSKTAQAPAEAHGGAIHRTVNELPHELTEPPAAAAAQAAERERNAETAADALPNIIQECLKKLQERGLAFGQAVSSGSLIDQGLLIMEYMKESTTSVAVLSGPCHREAGHVCPHGQLTTLQSLRQSWCALPKSDTIGSEYNQIDSCRCSKPVDAQGSWILPLQLLELAAAKLRHGSLALKARAKRSARRTYPASRPESVKKLKSLNCRSVWSKRLRRLDHRKQQLKHSPICLCPNTHRKVSCLAPLGIRVDSIQLSQVCFLLVLRK